MLLFSTKSNTDIVGTRRASSAPNSHRLHLLCDHHEFLPKPSNCRGAPTCAPISLKKFENSNQLRLTQYELMFYNRYCFLSHLCVSVVKNRIASVAATYTNCTAVATPEQSAELVPFRRQRASISPTQNVNSADYSLGAASHFGG